MDATYLYNEDDNCLSHCEVPRRDFVRVWSLEASLHYTSLI